MGIVILILLIIVAGVAGCTFLANIGKNSKGSSSSTTVAPNLPLRRYFLETTQPPKDYVVFDTETTGLDACTCEIIEIGAIRYRNHIEVERFHSYIQPVGPIRKDAATVNHISWLDLRNAPLFPEVHKKFIDFIGSDPVVGYNIGFDVKFIQTRSGSDLKNPCFDTLKLARRFVNTPDHKLGTVKEYFGILYKSHTALGDCQATAAVYQRILQMPGVQDAMQAESDKLDFHQETQQVPALYQTKHYQLWDAGEKERIAGNIEKALRLFDQARELCSDGSMPFLYESYAKAYRKQKAYENEISILSEAIASCSPEDALRFKKRKERAAELLSAQQKRMDEEQQRAAKRAEREARRKQEEAAKKNRLPPGRQIIQLDDSGTVIKVFPSVSAAAQEVGVDPKGIRSAATGIQKHAGGYCWKYADEFPAPPQSSQNLAVPNLDT